MTILFFLKPYQFYDRGGYFPKYIKELEEKAKKRVIKELEPILEVEAPVLSKEEEPKKEAKKSRPPIIKLDNSKILEQSLKNERKEALETLRKAIEVQKAREKAKKEHEALVAKQKAEQEEADIQEIIMVLNNHIEDTPYE